MNTRQVILPQSDIVKLFDEKKFDDINEYIVHMKSFHGLSPYKKDIKPAKFGNGLGELKMNHFSIRKRKVISENYRYFIINKKKWMLSRIKYGV